MGVDICWRFQREEKPGKWINLSSNYKGDRSYLHFAWLGFDVDRERASTSAVFIHALRGLPDNIPSEDDDLFGEHSYSWLTSEEILSAIPPDNAGEVIQEFVEEVKRLHVENGSVRFVFGFEG
ncbi:hypothetical protein QGM93_004400 [Escherichia coli]|nr:hypothetical protein [Escherichia coli]